jgi:hypothetical protein
MKKLIAFSAPILSGKTEQWKKFIGVIQGPRSKEFNESRSSLNIRERTFLQKTPMGDFVIVTLEGDDPAGAFAKFAQTETEFAKWFVKKVEDVHGFNLKDITKAPLPELLLDSDGQA